MKRLITAVAVLLMITAAAPLFAAQRRLVDDIVRMSRAGVSEDSIISFVQNTRGAIDLTADDLIVMTDAGLPQTLIKAVVDESAMRNSSQRYDRSERVYAPSVQFYAPYYSPYYSPYYYDPFFYGPRLSIGFGFGSGFHRGGGFRHGRH